MLIDTHAHLTFKEYSADLDEVVKRSIASGVQIINSGSSYETSLAAVKLAEKFPDSMRATVGCHPDDLAEEKFNYDKYLKLAKSSPKVVGIGEVGLDFFRLPEDKEKAEQIKAEQILVFKEFIKMARELSLPLVLHCRGEAKNPYETYGLMLEILKSEIYNLKPKTCGVIHCFGGNLTQAKEFIDLGFYIGITGIITFKNAKELQEIVREIPLEKILTETDSPFLAPEPFRGQRNEPAYVEHVCRKIAELKGIAFDQAAKQTFENARLLFHVE